MSDPNRLLLDAGAGSLEREILDAWREDQPSPAARNKTLAALGLASGVVAATGSIAPKAMAMTTTAILKWLGLVVIALAVGTGSVMYVHRDAAREVPMPAPLPMQAHVDAPPVVAASAVAPLDIDSLPTANPTSQTPAIPRSPHSAPRASSGDLSPQIALVDGARSALAAGDATRALSLAERYETEFPGGTFSQEAEFVRIEALVADGQHDEATRAGKRFLVAHPTSPHAAHVREILAL